jgi:hypothetical protein
MATDTGLDRVLGWIEKLNTSLEEAKSEHMTTRNLVTSAEYELQQLRRQLSGVVAAPDMGPAPCVPDTSRSRVGDFGMKLRHPDSIRHGWWSVVGLDK